MLIDLHFFNEKLHWTDRREILMKLAGKIQTPVEFEALLAELSGRTEDEYKKVIADQKKRLVKERDEINPRVDEQQGLLAEYAKHKDEDLNERRLALIVSISKLDDQRKSLIDSERKRAERLDNVNFLKSKRVERETALRNDTAGHTPLFTEKDKLQRAIADKESAIAAINRSILSKKADIDFKQSQSEQYQIELDKIRVDYLAMKSVDFSQSVCSACGQVLPEDKIEGLKKTNELKMQHLAAKGNQKKAEKANFQKQLEIAEAELKAIQDEIERSNIELKDAHEFANLRIAKIDEQLTHRVVVQPKDDPSWKQLCVDIDRLEQEIGAPMAIQLETLEQKRQEKMTLLNEIAKALTAADTADKAAARIDELKARERELGNQITILDGKLELIGQYQAHQSHQIELAVNSKFKYVSFKLFDVLLNESIEPCCEAILNGTPYSDCSYGEKNLIGANVINILSEHYGLSCPIFIDNSESMTLDLELNCQQIFLQAIKGTVLHAAPMEEKISVAELQEDFETKAYEPEVKENGFRCNMCNREFDIPGGKKTKLCPFCLSKEFEEK